MSQGGESQKRAKKMSRIIWMTPKQRIGDGKIAVFQLA